MTRCRRDASVLALLVMIVVFDGSYFETFDPKVGAHLANLLKEVHRTHFLHSSNICQTIIVICTLTTP